MRSNETHPPIVPGMANIVRKHSSSFCVSFASSSHVVYICFGLCVCVWKKRKRRAFSCLITFYSNYISISLSYEKDTLVVAHRFGPENVRYRNRLEIVVVLSVVVVLHSMSPAMSKCEKCFLLVGRPRHTHIHI